MPTIEYVHRLIPKQRAFFDAKAPECCYSGGYGAGKSRALLYKLVYRRLQHPRAIALVGRAKLQDTIETLLPLLLEWDGACPPILAPGQYSYVKSDRTIRIVGGGLIRLVGFGATNRGSLEKGRIRGHNVTDLAIDQAEELLEKQYLDVTGRLRATGEGLTRQANLSCNPSYPSHWIAKRFGFLPGTTPMPGCWGITAASADNPHLPPDYITRLNSYTGVMRERYVLGRWVAAEGAIYDNFRREVHVQRRTGPWAYTLIGCDDGISDPAAYYRVDVDNDGRAHFSREVYARGLAMQHKVASVLALGTPDQVRAVVVDPSAASLKLELRKVGYVVIDADNTILPGIGAARERMESGVDGQPMTTIDPCCKSLIEEVEAYIWDPEAAKETPVQGNDHACDVLRYISMHLYRPPAAVFDKAPIVPADYTARGELTTPLSGIALERAFRRGEGVSAQWREDKDGDGTMFGTPEPGRPYVLAVVAGEGGMPTLVAVGDGITGEIVYDGELHGTSAQAAKQIGLLCDYFGERGMPDQAAVLLNVPGRAIMGECSALSLPLGTWEPDAKQLAEGVAAMRAALYDGRLIEHDRRFVADAGQYVWVRGQVMHAALRDDPERQATWSDRVLVRALAYRLLQRVSIKAREPAPDRYFPSITARRRAR